MKSILDMEVTDFMLKDGDIKVNASELKWLISLIENYHKMLKVNSDNEDIDIIADNVLRFIEYFNNKYIVLNSIREEERTWFKYLKVIEERKYDVDIDQNKLENLKNEVLAKYKKYKSQRKKLLNELDKIKKDNYFWLY